MGGSMLISRVLRFRRAIGPRMLSVGSETTRMSRSGGCGRSLHLLKEHGVPVRMLRSENPGKVLYEDSYQIVVEEWKHL